MERRRAVDHGPRRGGVGGPAERIAVETTATVDRKVAALTCHKSQIADPEAIAQRMHDWARAQADVAGLPDGLVGRALPGHPHPLRRRGRRRSLGGAFSTWRSRGRAPSLSPSLIRAPTLTVVRVDRGEAVPPPAAVRSMAGLVVMGGPMSVHDDLPWLHDERALLRAAVDARDPRARRVPRGPAAGRRARRRRDAGPGSRMRRRRGAPDDSAIDDPVFGPAPTPLPCVHWHGDTFSLPEGAVRLAGNDAYENQAFRVGTRAYGLQFHVEVTASLVAHWGPHLPPGVFVRAPTWPT